MATSRAPMHIEIDGMSVQITRLVHHEETVMDGNGDLRKGEGGELVHVPTAELHVTLMEDGDDPNGEATGEDQEYLLLASDADASLLAIDRVRNSYVGTKDNIDFSTAVTMMGNENLVKWALGMESNGCRSVQEWVERAGEDPGNTLGGYNGTAVDVGRVSTDVEPEYLQDLGEDSWQRLVQEIGFVPTIAYRTN